MAPKAVHILLPGTCGYVTWQKGLFAGVTKLRILRWEIILGYPGGPIVIARVLIRGKTEGSERCDGEPEVGLMLVLEGAMNQGLWVASRSWERQGTGSALSPPEATQPCQFLSFYLIRLILDFKTPEV